MRRRARARRAPGSETRAVRATAKAAGIEHALLREDARRVKARQNEAERHGEDGVPEVSYFSLAYLCGAIIMIAGVICPFGYMLMLNNKSLKARMTK